MSDTKKRPSYKKRAQAFEAALNEMELQFARTKGLLGTMVHIFGTSVMQAVRVFHDDPTPENFKKITEALENPRLEED